MRRITIGALGLLLALPASSSGVSAATFSPLAFPGADRALLDRGASRADLGRDLMGSARSGVILGRVDVYDRFPFLEARYLQVVSDPTWNRLLFGDPAAGLAAYDGAASGFGQLDAPAGLAATAGAPLAGTGWPWEGSWRASSVTVSAPARAPSRTSSSGCTGTRPRRSGRPKFTRPSPP